MPGDAKKPLREFFEQYVDGTTEKARVPIAQLNLCNLTNIVAARLELDGGKTFSVHVSTRALKHLYDKKPAEEFSCILDGLDEVVRYPMYVYRNKGGKRGTYCVVGAYDGISYICSLEIIVTSSGGLGNVPMGLEPLGGATTEIEIQVATAFRKRDEKYLAKCVLLWSREDGTPPS